MGFGFEAKPRARSKSKPNKFKTDLAKSRKKQRGARPRAPRSKKSKAVSTCCACVEQRQNQNRYNFTVHRLPAAIKIKTSMQRPGFTNGSDERFCSTRIKKEGTKVSGTSKTPSFKNSASLENYQKSKPARSAQASQMAVGSVVVVTTRTQNYEWLQVRFNFDGRR